MNKQVAISIKLVEKPWTVVIEAVRSNNNLTGGNYARLTILWNGRRVWLRLLDHTTFTDLKQQLEQSTQPQMPSQMPPKLIFTLQLALLLASTYSPHILGEIPSVCLN